MLLLETGNKIIEDTLKEKFAQEPGKYEPVDATVADFDAVMFHIHTHPENKNIVFVSMSMKFYAALKAAGVDDIMKQKYGSLIAPTEQGYDITLQIDISNAAESSKIPLIANLKRNALAAPFAKVFADIEAKKAGSLVEIPYRDGECIFIKPESDRCIVIFSILFKDPDDAIFAKVFLQAYQDEKKTMNNVPAVSYSHKEPPLEIKGAKSLRIVPNMGFVSFVLFAPHMSGGKREKTIDMIQNFRNYLHYHIKCSKGYLHNRFRVRVRTFLQVLNRAKQEQENKEKRTITGKTFKRADDPQGAADSEFINI